MNHCFNHFSYLEIEREDRLDRKGGNEIWARRISLFSSSVGVTRVSPLSGSVAGGTRITLTGTGKGKTVTHDDMQL